MTAPSGLDLELIRRLERHSVASWPPLVCEPAGDGWMLRATPGLQRGRSNHALTPPRSLSAQEIVGAPEIVRAFAAREGIRPGIQVSPLELHGPLLEELGSAGWDVRTPVCVLVASPAEVVATGAALALSVADHADDAWLAAWGACESARDVEAHRDTVFSLLRSQARFVRDGQRAVGIAVESDGLIGLFCLAVLASERRQGLGSALVRGMLVGAGAGLVYLQVESTNVPALAMYERLGFTESYRYCHCVAPE